MRGGASDVPFHGQKTRVDRGGIGRGGALRPRVGGSGDVQPRHRRAGRRHNKRRVAPSDERFDGGIDYFLLQQTDTLEIKGGAGTSGLSIQVNAPGQTLLLKLSGATIDATGGNSPALSIDGGSTVNLTLAGDSTLTGDDGSSGVAIQGYSALNVTGTDADTLTVNSGANAYGIYMRNGTFSLSGGAVYVNGADIGMICFGNDGRIAVSGGTLDVTSNGSTGILNPCPFVISGGIVNARSKGVGAGIHQINYYTQDGLHITGGTVNAHGSGGGAGIGGGVDSAENNARIQISGGTVTAVGSQHAGGAIGDDIGRGALHFRTFPPPQYMEYLAINGGSVNASTIYPQPKNQAEDKGNPVYRTTLTLMKDGQPLQNQPVTALSVSPALVGGYGLNDVSTDGDGKLYVFLPEGARTLSVTADNLTYQPAPGETIETSSDPDLPTSGTLYWGAPAPTSPVTPTPKPPQTGDGGSPDVWGGVALVTALAFALAAWRRGVRGRA